MFRDREEAGRQLAERLRLLDLHAPLVLGIPRGGVATGAAIARSLGAELDVVLARKLRAPLHPELAIGAIAENGHVYHNRPMEHTLGITADYLEEEIAREWGEIEKRRKLYRPVRPAAAIQGRTVILTDDGIATGATMFAAMEVVRQQAAHDVIIAVPVAPQARLSELRRECDRVMCLLTPAELQAVGQFYENFDPVDDEQVMELLSASVPAGDVSHAVPISVVTEQDE